LSTPSSPRVLAGMAEWLVRDWPSLSTFHLSHPHQGTNGPGHYAQSAAGTHGIGRQSGHRVQGIVGSPVERKWCMLTHQRGGGGRTHAGLPLSASIVAGQGSATGWSQEVPSLLTQYYHITYRMLSARGEPPPFVKLFVV